MSYPFQGGSHNHPYPPSMSYASAPPFDNPSYPPQAGQAPYPPYPPQPSQPGYPSSTPYPPQPGYPSSTPSTPYPNSAPYPPTPYPPTTPSYPSQGHQPYPGNPSYPPQQGHPSSHLPYSPQGPASSHVPYPPQHGTSPSPYPPQHGHSPYPPQTAGYPSATPGYPSSGQVYPTLPSQPGYPGGSHHQHGVSSHPVHKSQPTVKPANPFNPRADAEVLRKAMKGFGTDEAAIIAVLGKRTNLQRLEIAKEFKTLYGKDLVSNLKSETSGKFEQLLVAMLTPIPEFYASEVKHALSGIGTNESTLIEVLCTLSNAELHYIKVAYEKLYKSSMESDLRGDTSGSFKRLLTALCQGRRDENNYVDSAAAEADAQALLKAGELRFGTDESTFNAILCTRSFAQLQAVFAAYERVTGHSIEKAVKKEFSGDIEDGLLAIVQCVRNRATFLAKCLHDSMAGAGTNDRALIRLIVTRSEIDLEDIKREFSAKYGKTVESFIKGDASGDYKKLLIALQE